MDRKAASVSLSSLYPHRQEPEPASVLYRVLKGQLQLEPKLMRSEVSLLIPYSRTSLRSKGTAVHIALLVLVTTS